MLFSHKKEQSIDTCYSKNEPFSYYSKWEKPDTKNHMLYDFIYMRCSEQINL